MSEAEPTSGTIRVLLVEDNLDHAMLAQRGFDDENVEVTHVRTGADALEALERGAFDVCLLDHRLPDTEGVRLCQRVRERGHDGLIFLVTGAARDSLVDRAFEAGADDYIVKGPSLTGRIAENLRTLLGAGEA